MFPHILHTTVPHSECSWTGAPHVVCDSACLLFVSAAPLDPFPIVHFSSFPLRCSAPMRTVRVSVYAAGAMCARISIVYHTSHIHRVSTWRIRRPTICVQCGSRSSVAVAIKICATPSMSYQSSLERYCQRHTRSYLGSIGRYRLICMHRERIAFGEWEAKANECK